MNSTSTSSARRVARLSALATVALLAVPVAAAPANASGGGRVESASRACASGVIKVKAKADDGRLEVEGEVDTNRRGQTWAWSIRRDGNVAARGTGTTAGRSGSFSVERRIANPAGSDRIVFRAVRNGQVCRAAVTF
jgi:hypothetical protein